MNFWIANCAGVFLLCVFCAGIVIPQILLIAFRKQLMDVPDERKIHRSLVPRLRGIAFKPVIFFLIAFVLGVKLALGNDMILAEALRDAHAVLFGFCAVMVRYLVGMADDLVGSPASRDKIVTMGDGSLKTESEPDMADADTGENDRLS